MSVVNVLSTYTHCTHTHTHKCTPLRGRNTSASLRVNPCVREASGLQCSNKRESVNGEQACRQSGCITASAWRSSSTSSPGQRTDGGSGSHPCHSSADAPRVYWKMSRDLAAAPPFDLPETGRGAALNPTHWVRANSNSCNVKKSQWVLWGGEEGAGGPPWGQALCSWDVNQRGVQWEGSRRAAWGSDSSARLKKKPKKKPLFSIVTHSDWEADVVLVTSCKHHCVTLSEVWRGSPQVCNVFL